MSRSSTATSGSNRARTECQSSSWRLNAAVSLCTVSTFSCDMAHPVCLSRVKHPPTQTDPAPASGAFPAAAFADEVEWHQRGDIPDTGVCRGPDEIAHMLADGWATVTRPWIRVEQMVDAGEQVVVRW